MKDKDPRTYAIIGAAMEVHAELGAGFLESVYQEALAMEMGDRDIPFRREVTLSVRYKGRVLKDPFRADFVCFNEVIVELKAIKGLTAVEDAQLLNYLKATGYSVGLFINFGSPRLEFKRMVNGYVDPFS